MVGGGDEAFEIEEPTAVSAQSPSAVQRGAARWPDLSGLSDPQLSALRGALQRLTRDARKKAIAAMSKDKELGKLHVQALGKPGSAADLELARRLPECPDAFVADFVANSLVELDSACLDLIRARFRAATKA